MINIDNTCNIAVFLYGFEGIGLLSFSKYIKCYVKYSQTCILALGDTFNDFESSIKSFEMLTIPIFIVPKLFRNCSEPQPGPARPDDISRAGPGRATEHIPNV